MGGVEADRKAKRFSGWIGIDELDRRIAAQLGLMAQASILLLLQVGVAADGLEEIKDVLAAGVLKSHPILAGKAGSIAGFSQLDGIARGDVLLGNLWRAEIVSVGPLCESGEKGGATGSADRRLNK